MWPNGESSLGFNISSLNWFYVRGMNYIWKRFLYEIKEVVINNKYNNNYIHNLFIVHLRCFLAVLFCVFILLFIMFLAIFLGVLFEYSEFLFTICYFTG